MIYIHPSYLLTGGFATIAIYFLSAASWIAVARNTEYAIKLLKV